eukprot:Colp12_sorted_trinity150504_noHs@20203
MGKGEGRGVVGCLCFIFFIGPILMIVGIVFLISAGQHIREDNVAAYNNLALMWETTNQANVLNSTVTSGVTSFNLRTYGDALLDGRPNDFVPYNRSVYYQYLPQPLTSITINGVQVSLNLPAMKTMVMDKGDMDCCDYNECTYSSKSCRSRCSGKAYCSDVCNSYRGSYSGGICRATVYLQSACVSVLDWKNVKLGNVNTGVFNSGGCYYEARVQYASNSPPFEIGSYSPNPPGATMMVEVRDARDPFIFASYATDGTYDFGLTSGQKVAIGIPLIATGAVITLIVIVIIMKVTKMCCFGLRTYRPATVITTQSVSTVPLVYEAAPQPVYAQPYPTQPEPFSQPQYAPPP